MDRRTFVKGGAAGALATGAAAISAPAIARTRDLTMIMTWPKNTPGVGVNAARFVDHVTAITGGTLKISLFGAGDVVPAFESLDAVSSGTVDLCHSTPYYWTGRHKALHFFTGVPFGLTAQEMAAWMRFGDGLDLWHEVYADFGVKPFYAGSSGAQASGWFRREIYSPDDLRGLKFRIAGLGGEILRRMGVTPVVMPPAEIGPALISGAIDGAEWIGPWNDMAFGLYRGAKYYYMPGPLEPGPGLEIIVNSRTWEELSAEHRAAIDVAATAIAHETLADFTYNNMISLTPLVTLFNVQLRQFDERIVATMAEHAEAVWREIGAEDPLTEKVHASFAAFWDRARAYAPHAEGGFLRQRAAIAT